jgi:hypothetical protein
MPYLGLVILQKTGAMILYIEYELGQVILSQRQ